MPGTTIDSSSVVAAFGSYYIDSGQSESNIHEALREAFDSQNIFTVVESDDTVLRETNATFAELLQAFQTAWTPKGGVTHTPVEIPLFNVKVDVEVYPDQLKNQWLSFMTSNKLDRTEWPYVRWLVEKYVMVQVAADIENNLYGATRVAPTAGTAGAANNSFDGLKKIINALITAGSIAPIATGAPSTTATTWTNQVEAFISSIPELYWTKTFGLNMSRALALRYRQGRGLKYNSNYAQVSDREVVQDFEQISAKGFASMSGKPKIWGTMKENAILGFKGKENMKTVEIEKVDRKVKIYTDFWLGLGFINPGLVFTNDQDLT